VSAFVVTERHVDVIIAAGLRPGSLPGSRLKWLRSLSPIEWVELDHDTANQVGGMLLAENVRSVVYRYADADGMIPDHALAEYVFTQPPRDVPTTVEAFKAIDCLVYQSCEHSEWEASEAYRFCEALRRRLIHQLPGYDDAPYVWNDGVLASRSNVVRLR
jgi:hypothetical protein